MPAASRMKGEHAALRDHGLSASRFLGKATVAWQVKPLGPPIIPKTGAMFSLPVSCSRIGAGMPDNADAVLSAVCPHKVNLSRPPMQGSHSAQCIVPIVKHK